MLFRQRGRLLRANYYAALAADKDFDFLRPLIDWLDLNVARRNLQHDNNVRFLCKADRIFNLTDVAKRALDRKQRGPTR